MNQIRYTLLSDGSSDRALMPILGWLLRNKLPTTAVQDQWADLGSLPKPPKTLIERIKKTLDLYPCDLLFIHRDAETESYQNRKAEIEQAVAEYKQKYEKLSPHVCVVPVRMQEAWLLIDEPALRRAAGNPNGKKQLKLPPVKALEGLPDPKDTLYNLLREASELSGRRRKQFKPDQAAHRLAELIDDFSPLRHLSAFGGLETDVDQFISQLSS